FERGPRRPLHAKPVERAREIGNRLGAPPRLAPDDRAHGLDASVLAGNLVSVLERMKFAGPRGARRARRMSRDEVEHAGKLEHGERVLSGLHADAPSSSRAMRLIVPPSARPLYCAITLPITAPMFAAPPLIALRTASRSSSSLTAAGR